MQVLWVCYSTTANNNPFGRTMIGYCGWHATQKAAFEAALQRYPERISEIDINNVNRV